MKLNRWILSLFCIVFSLSAYQHQSCTYNIDTDEYAAVLYQFQNMVYGIANLSGNQKIPSYLQALDVSNKKNIADNYTNLCMITDWSLKDCKMICSSRNNQIEVEKKLGQIAKNYSILPAQLIAMQRHNRMQVKHIISQVKHLDDSDCLQRALQELYHALHEIKKQIATIDKSYPLGAWYIYVTMLYLDFILMQAMKAIESCLHNKVELQVLMHQLFCITERFSHSIRFDFITKKEV